MPTHRLLLLTEIYKAISELVVSSGVNCGGLLSRWQRWKTRWHHVMSLGYVSSSIRHRDPIITAGRLAPMSQGQYSKPQVSNGGSGHFSLFGKRNPPLS